MASNPHDFLREDDFNGYVVRHEQDEFAHAAMRHSLRNELTGSALQLDRRVTLVERLVWMGLGMATLLGTMIAGGTVGLIVELARGR